MSGFRDIHAHFVYGVDDGAQTKEKMEAMLDMAHENGVTSLYATPHITPGVYPFDEALFAQHFEEAQAYCRQKGYPITLHAGAEIMYTPMIRRCAEEKMLPLLGDTEHILMEFVPDVSYREIEEAVSLMERSGYSVILAHIERYDCLYHKKNAYRLREEHDVRFQVNCGTVIDRRGFLRDRCITKWFRDGLISYVASDAHGCTRRPCRMKQAYEVLCQRVGEECAARVTGLHHS